MLQSPRNVPSEAKLLLEDLWLLEACKSILEEMEKFGGDVKSFSNILEKESTESTMARQTLSGFLVKAILFSFNRKALSSCSLAAPLTHRLCSLPSLLRQDVHRAGLLLPLANILERASEIAVQVPGTQHLLSEFDFREQGIYVHMRRNCITYFFSRCGYHPSVTEC